MSQAGGGLSPGDIERWATAVAKILACGGVERSQVQKLLEVVNSASDDPFFTLEAFVLYQASRVWRNKVVGRLLVEAVEWLRQKGARVEELQRALGYAKWIFYAYERGKRRLCGQFRLGRNVSFANLIQGTNPSVELLNVAQSLA